MTRQSHDQFTKEYLAKSTQKKESGRRHYQAPFSPTLPFAAEAIRNVIHIDKNR